MSKLYVAVRRIFASIIPKRLPSIGSYAYRLYSGRNQSNIVKPNKKLWYNPHAMLEAYIDCTNQLTSCYQLKGLSHIGNRSQIF